MARFTGVHTPNDNSLSLEDSFGLQCDPVSAEGAVARVVWKWNRGLELLKPLDKGAVFLDFEFGQLLLGQHFV